jgi:peroxiredoxin
LVQLQSKQPEFAKNGLQLVGLSYDSVSKLATFAKKKQLSYRLLSDEGSKTIRALDLEYKRGLPYPGTFIIGKDGAVKGKLFKEDFKKRHSVDEILKKAIEVSATNGGSTSKTAVGSTKK